MAGMKRDFGVRLWLALGLFILAGIFRQMDRGMGSLPSAICFLLTNFIYIGMAMAWGFSISRRILHRRERKWLLLGCAMMVLWLFLRAVKYRFFRGGCHYPAAMVFILCAADSCAAFQRICRLAAGAEGGCAVFRPLVFSVHTSGAADWRGFDE